MYAELDPTLLQCQLIVSEMQHFVQQIQYYINFEVTLDAVYSAYSSLFSPRKRGIMFLPALVCVSVCVSVSDHDN